MEKLARDKHSDLFQTSPNYGFEIIIRMDKCFNIFLTECNHFYFKDFCERKRQSNTLSVHIVHCNGRGKRKFELFMIFPFYRWLFLLHFIVHYLPIWMLHLLLVWTAMFPLGQLNRVLSICPWKKLLSLLVMMSWWLLTYMSLIIGDPQGIFDQQFRHHPNPLINYYHSYIKLI